MNVRVEPGGAEDGSALGENATHVIPVERLGAALHQAFPPVEDADDLVVVFLDAAGDHGSDHGIEAGAIPAGSEYSDDTHGVSSAINTGTSACR